MLVLFFSLVVVFVFSAPAFSYLDGGTGSLILQFVIGGIAGVLIFLKMWWGKIRDVIGFFKKWKVEKK